MRAPNWQPNTLGLFKLRLRGKKLNVNVSAGTLCVVNEATSAFQVLFNCSFKFSLHFSMLFYV